MKTILFLLFILFSTLIYGQSATECISYEYDAAGNRVLRKVIPITGKKTEKEEEGHLVGAQTEEGIFSDDSDNSNGPEPVLTTYEDMLGETKLTIFPNPTTGALQVDIPDLDNVNQGLIRVYDLNGRTLFEERVSKTTTTVDLSEEVNGTYILLLNINGKTSEWKVVKQD